MPDSAETTLYEDLEDAIAEVRPPGCSACRLLRGDEGMTNAEIEALGRALRLGVGARRLEAIMASRDHWMPEKHIQAHRREGHTV